MEFDQEVPKEAPAMLTRLARDVAGTVAREATWVAEKREWRAGLLVGGEPRLYRWNGYRWSLVS